MRLKIAAVAVVAAVATALGGAASATPGSVRTILSRQGWSGYTTYIGANTNGQPNTTVYYADARWTVPNLDCKAADHRILGLSSSVSMWVGLGGVTLLKDSASGNLVQAGVLSRCGLYHQYVDAVYQIRPTDTYSIFLNAKRYPVKPGDSVDVTVEQHSNHVYSMEIANGENGKALWVWAKRIKVSFGNVPDSADYIVEKPGPYQADFGTVTFHMSNYDTFPLGSCPECGPSFLNDGFAWRWVAVNILHQKLTEVGPLSNPLGADPGTFSVTWKQGS
jgi:hypothetical protein